MKYLISTNVGDFIFTKKRLAKTWLKDLHSQNPKIKNAWVYDETGWWESCAEIDENGKVVEGFYCPDGELRVWVIWACRTFDNNDFCKDYEEAYYLAYRLDKVAEKERQKQGGYIHDYEEFINAAKETQAI